MQPITERLEQLHIKLIDAVKKQKAQSTSLELAIVKSNGQIPRAFKEKRHD